VLINLKGVFSKNTKTVPIISIEKLFKAAA